MIYQVVMRMVGGGFKSFALEEDRPSAIRHIERLLADGQALSAVMRDRSGAVVWSGQP